MGEVEKEVFEDRPSKAAMEELMEDRLSRVVMKGGVIPNLAESLPTDPSLPSLPWGFSVFLQGKDIISLGTRCFEHICLPLSFFIYLFFLTSFWTTSWACLFQAHNLWICLAFRMLLKLFSSRMKRSYIFIFSFRSCMSDDVVMF